MNDRKVSSEELDYCHEEMLPLMLEMFNEDSGEFEPDEERYCDKLCGWFTPETARDGYSSAINTWLNGSTPAEMVTLVGLLKRLSPLGEQEAGDPALLRERSAARSFITRFVPDEDYRCYAHGMLAHVSAFTTPVGPHHDAFMEYAWDCYLGLFELDSSGCTTIPAFPVDQTTAILRYLFEFRNANYFSEDSPVTQSYVLTPPRNGRSLRQPTITFKDTALRDLIAENHERVDELITLTQARDTVDAGLLRELLDSSDPRSLVSGTL